MTTKPKPRKGSKTAKSQYDLYPMPFFDGKTHCTWKVQPTGNYFMDCHTGRDYALEFLKSCDGTIGWASLLNQIAHDMVTAGPMARKVEGWKSPLKRHHHWIHEYDWKGAYVHQ